MYMTVEAQPSGLWRVFCKNFGENAGVIIYGFGYSEEFIHHKNPQILSTPP